MIPLNVHQDRLRRLNPREKHSNEATGIKSRNPLTLTLSPSAGEREKLSCDGGWLWIGDDSPGMGSCSLAPSEGERVRVRGFWHYI